MKELTPEETKQKWKLLEELSALNGRRSLKPNIQDNGRTRIVMEELYKLTQDTIYNINN
jgi:hypothetical protein